MDAQSDQSQSSTALLLTPHRRLRTIWWFRLFVAISAIMYGYSMQFLTGLINMPQYLFSLSPKAYDSYNTAITTNFCGYTDSLVLWLFLFMPFGVCCGIFLGQRLRFAWMNLVFGSMLIVSGAIVCTQVSKPVVHAFSYFFLGLGNGFVREVIPALLLQIAPSHESDRLDSIFDFGSLFGGFFSNLVNYLVFVHFRSLWRIDFYILVIFGSLVFFISMFIGVWGIDRYTYESRTSVYRVILSNISVLSIRIRMSMIPQYLMLAPLVFIGPLLLESFEIWVGSSFLVVGIGSFLAFAIVCFVTPWVIPRYGRRVVTVVSFTVIGGLQWLLFVASRIAFTTQYHIHEPFNTIAGISVVMIYVMHGAANGPHGLTAMKYPIVADRVCRGIEIAFLTCHPLFFPYFASKLICFLGKWVFLYMCLLASVYPGMIYFLVRQ